MRLVFVATIFCPSALAPVLLALLLPPPVSRCHRPTLLLQQMVEIAESLVLEIAESLVIEIAA